MILHSRIDGNGGDTDRGSDDIPVIVFLGSLGSTLEMWDPQVESLSTWARCVRLDHRGHGGTSSVPGPYTLADLGDDVLETLDGLGIERAHLVGLSIGAMVAMSIAEHEPDRVDRLALLCTSAALGPPSAWTERAELVRRDGMDAVAATVVARWFTDAYADDHPDEIARFVDMIRATDVAGYAGCCEAIATMDLLGALPSITTPTLVIAGSNDPATPVEHAEQIVEHVLDAKLATVDGAHLASWESAPQVNDLLHGHLLPGLGG